MPVIVDSKSIIPAPLVKIEKEVERNASGHKKRSVFVVTLTGTILPHKGSPRSDGSFWTTSGYPADEIIAADSCMASIRTKQGKICELFCTERKWLEWQPFDGTASSKCQFRLRNTVFNEGVWVQRCDYVITLECDQIYFGSQVCCADDGDLDPCDEAWEIEQGDDAARTYRLTHSVSATFRDELNTDGTVASFGWERAKTKVTERLGFNSAKLIQDGILNLDDFTSYNHTRSVNENRSDGVYRVTETWLCFNVDGGPAAIEDYTISTRVQAGRSTVSIEGSINGLYTRDGDFQISATKYEGASAKWDVVRNLLLSRAQASSGLTLNPTALSLQVAKNELVGTLNYSAEFDDRFTFGNAISTEINIQDNNIADVFASIPVVARPAGPVLQNILSGTETSRTVSVDCQFPPLVYGGTAVKPNVAALLTLYRPVAAQIFVARSEDSWSVVSGRFTSTLTYVYQ